MRHWTFGFIWDAKCIKNDKVPVECDIVMAYE